MADIFVLQGTRDRGKSTTLKQVLSDLQKKYSSAKIIKDFYPGQYDVSVIMSKVKGYTVGIESYGDDPVRIQQSLTDFENAGCDIIFCASKTRGKTVNAVNSHSGKYKITPIYKPADAPAQCVAANKKMAQNLIQKAGL